MTKFNLIQSMPILVVVTIDKEHWRNWRIHPLNNAYLVTQQSHKDQASGESCNYYKQKRKLAVCRPTEIMTGNH